eukprot:6254944-Amphidinium_carterae.2
MDTRYTNPVTGCRAVLMDTSLAYEPGVLVAHTQIQHQSGAVEITAATAVLEELLLEHDWWIRNEWNVEPARVMYEVLSQHTEAINLMRASCLDPTRSPELINLKRAAFAVDYDPKQLTRIRTHMPGLMRGHSLWNFIIREEAMEKFRTYFRLSHMIGVQITKEEQEQYFCSVPSRTCTSYASHEYRVVYVVFPGLEKSRKGNWQWNNMDPRYHGEVVGKGFFFYWYGLITIDTAHGVIAAPEFLKDAQTRSGIVHASTAPSPLSALKSDFARQRVEKDAEEFTKGTVADLLRKGERDQRRKKRKEAMAAASSNPAPAIASIEGKQDARGKVLSSPGVDESSSETDEEIGAQDQQDREAEGPLAARKITKYAPHHKVTNTEPFKGGFPYSTGTDVQWAKLKGMRYGTGWEAFPELHPNKGHYLCPACNLRFHLSEMLADHVTDAHGMGLEPNFNNEYSVAELVSGVNNLAVGKKFRVDDGESRPKFVMTKPGQPDIKIPWMGLPIFEEDFQPMSIETKHDEDGQVFRSYRVPPQGQLAMESAAIDLRRRLQPGDESEPEIEPPTARRPLIPAELTSQLWRTKTVSPKTVQEMRRRANGEVVEEPEEEPFSNMSPWRNLVRAWEMRNHEKLNTSSWHDICYPDPHPADMSILTQGATMTPTVMREGQWDTWSFGDLMVPEQLMSMLAKDHDSHDMMTDEKKNLRWHHVIKPLLDSLGFKMVGRDGTNEWNPANGLLYYQDFYGRLDSLQRKYRVPDPSVFVNHEVVHYIAHQKDITQALKQWEKHALQGDYYIVGTMMCVPGRMERHNEPAKYDATTRQQEWRLRGHDVKVFGYRTRWMLWKTGHFFSRLWRTASRDWPSGIDPRKPVTSR